MVSSCFKQWNLVHFMVTIPTYLPINLLNQGVVMYKIVLKTLVNIMHSFSFQVQASFGMLVHFA